MTELLDSPELRLVLYVVAAIAALLAWARERDDLATRDSGVRWPRFWLLSAALLAAMGVARAVDLGDVISDLGRDRAVSDGWYDTRLLLQVAVVGAMATVWGLSVLGGLWGVLERRGRYMPAAAMLVSLVCFAAVRVVSLHHVDALLYRRDLLGLRFVSLIELSLLAATIASMHWFPFDTAENDVEVSRPG